MKSAATVILLLFFISACGQPSDFQSLLDSGKAEFTKEFDQQDYSRAADYLEKAVNLNPNYAEVHYFLGYAYSRINSKDGKSMINMSLPLTIKTSEQFEMVNKLSPLYTGEMVILDPYSKLTAEWGSLAMSYWHNNLIDSAVWAFQEGKKRGAFGEYILSLNRKVLDACSQNAMLISSGDNFTIPLWYLQIVEGYRRDVSVVDISLLNTAWYPSHLVKANVASFDLPSYMLDTVEYCPWVDSTITVASFTWTVKPSYAEGYILRGDRLFLSLLKENNFRRDVYFTIGFAEESRLSLTDHLIPLVVADKVNDDNQINPSLQEYERVVEDVLSLVPLINKNSREELRMLNNFRYGILGKISECKSNDDILSAKQLLSLLDKYANEADFPFEDDDVKSYINNLRQELRK